MRRVLTAAERDQLALKLICREAGWWLVLSYEKHLAQLARATRPRTIEEILEDEDLLTDLDGVVESL